MPRRRLTRKAAQTERHVRAHDNVAIEVPTREIIALLITHEERKPAMPADRRRGCLKKAIVPKIERLRKLHHVMTAATLDDGDPIRLMGWP